MLFKYSFYFIGPINCIQQKVIPKFLYEDHNILPYKKNMPNERDRELKLMAEIPRITKTCVEK